MARIMGAVMTYQVTIDVVPARARIGARDVRTRSVGEVVRMGAWIGALSGLLIALALADPAPLLIHISNVMRLVATGAIAGGCGAGMLSEPDSRPA